MVKEKTVTYELRAYVDGALVYKGEYADTTELQSNGLRKAEYQVEQELDHDD